ncbi:hypothetical protein Trydic_g5078 [Trypoxylus dichotomus]
MDRSADPCVDFYQYACGGWMKANPVPDWTATWDRLALLRESVMRDMRQLLDSGKNFNKDNITEPEGIRKARSFYKSCMNTSEYLRGGLCIIEQTSPGFGEKYFLHTEKFLTELKHYKNHLTLMTSAYISGSVREEFSDDILQFSTQIAKAMTPPEKRRSSTHLFHEVTLQQLVSGPASNNASWKIALEMLEDIKYAFKIAIEDLNWMDYVTREKTLTKLHAIRAFVGYPGWIMNATQLDKHYKNANVVNDNYFTSFLNLANSLVKKKLERLREKPNKNRWVSAATTVNAFYSATLNSVTFPAGILKPPFYDNGIPALDYAAIGAIMGHEITHGFDDQGRRYDENGNLKQWWSTATLMHYQEKVECIIKQYNNYWMPDLGPMYAVNGFNTQGENIADNGGLRAAYEAYKHRKQKSAIMDQRLPGLLDITTDQLFFLGFAQIWCGNCTVGALKSRLLDGVHSPNRIRVIGTLSNMKEFSVAWKCPRDSPMNPLNKCILW